MDMILYAALVLALSGFALVFYFMMRSAERRADRAEQRLYAAWKDGYVIPPPPDEAPPKEREPLDNMLQLLINDWESPETRIQLEEAFREQLELGFSSKAVAAQYLDGKFEYKPSV